MFKHFPFSDQAELDEFATPKENEQPWQYNRRFYDARKGLVGGEDSDYLKWADFKQAAAHLADLVVCSEITLKPRNLPQKAKEDSKWSNRVASINDSHKDFNRFRVSISFRQFLRSGHQLSYKVFFYPYGLREGNPQELDITSPVQVEPGTSDQPPGAVVDFRISAAKLTDHSEILFTCRLDIGMGKAYPSPLDGEARWLGARSGTRQHIRRARGRGQDITTKSIAHTNTRIDTLDNLTTRAGWQS